MDNVQVNHFSKAGILTSFKEFLETRINSNQGLLTSTNVFINYKKYLTKGYSILKTDSFLEKYDPFDLYDNFYQLKLRELSKADGEKNIDITNLRFDIQHFFIPKRYIGVEIVIMTTKEFFNEMFDYVILEENTMKRMVETIEDVLLKNDSSLNESLVKAKDNTIDEYLEVALNNESDKYGCFSTIAAITLFDNYLKNNAAKVENGLVIGYTYPSIIDLSTKESVSDFVIRTIKCHGTYYGNYELIYGNERLIDLCVLFLFDNKRELIDSGFLENNKITLENCINIFLYETVRNAIVDMFGHSKYEKNEFIARVKEIKEDKSIMEVFYTANYPHDKILESIRRYKENYRRSIRYLNT